MCRKANAGYVVGHHGPEGYYRHNAAIIKKTAVQYEAPQH